MDNLRNVSKPVNSILTVGGLAWLAGLVVLAGCVIGCGEASEDLLVKDAWSRPSGSSGERSGPHSASDAYIPPAAVYFTLQNNEDEADLLTGGRTDLAERIEIHRSQEDAMGVMRMRHHTSVDILPESELRFEPGGYHLMVLGLKRPLEEGMRFPITLYFERTGPVPVEVEVRRQ